MTISSKPIMTAVITGNHDFEVPAFINLFRALEGIDFYPQSLEDYSADLAKVRENYEAVGFYNMHSQPNAVTQRVYETLGEIEQGVVFLHHGMLAYRDWPLMAEITGSAVRNFNFWPGEKVKVEIADPAHPITRGLESWEMEDETYTLPEPGAGSHVLLTTNNPHSVKALAWTRMYKKARVLVYASGHGKEAYTNPGFQAVLGRGIAWAAGRIS